MLSVFLAPFFFSIILYNIIKKKRRHRWLGNEDRCDFVSKINGIDKNGYKLTAEEAIAMAEVTEAYMKQKRRQM